MYIYISFYQYMHLCFHTHLSVSITYLHAYVYKHCAPMHSSLHTPTHTALLPGDIACRTGRKLVENGNLQVCFKHDQGFGKATHASLSLNT